VSDRLSIRAATIDDAEALSELAIRSKGYWGYSPEFLDACRGELSVDAGRIGKPGFFCCVAVRDEQRAGYFTLTRQSSEDYELDALFVEPEFIGKGIGHALLSHAIEQLRSVGAKRLSIQGDPNAHDFYVSHGAIQTGTRPSGSIAGRDLPLYTLDLSER